MPEITVVIPVAKGDTPALALRTLQQQTLQAVRIIVEQDRGGGCNATRNLGFAKADTEFVINSDCDIEWRPTALQTLYDTLQAHSEASYAYGSYGMEGKIQCDQVFNAARLRRTNFISSMSLIRRQDLPSPTPWNPEIRRLMDWDLWLTLLEHGRIGVYCGQQIFSTRRRIGITYGQITQDKTLDGKLPSSYDMTHAEAKRIVKGKHGLL